MNNSDCANTRTVWIDITRALAILSVVLMHAYEQAEVENLACSSIESSLGRIGVPLFLMISGALMFPKACQYSICGYFRKYAKRIIQFLLLLAGYSLFTNLVNVLFIQGESISNVVSFLLNNNGLTGKGVAVHMWYLRDIAGLYIILPFLVRCLVPRGNWFVCFVIALCFLSIVSQTISDIKILSFVLPYIGYFILGYLVVCRLHLDNRRVAVIFSALLIASGLLSALFIDLWNNGIQQRLHWYSSSFTILISSLGCLIFLREIFKNCHSCSPVVASLSKCSFGIYLSHYLFLLLCKDFICNTFGDSINDHILTGIYFFVPLTVSWACTAWIIRIPYLRKIVS